MWILREQIATTHAALGQHADVLRVSRRVWDDALPMAAETAEALIVLGTVARLIAGVGEPAEGLERATTVAALWRDHHPPDRREALVQRAQRARLLQLAERWGEAESEQRAVLAIGADTLPAESAARGAIHLQRGGSLLKLGRTAEAATELDRGLAIAARLPAGSASVPELERYRTLAAGLQSTTR